MAVVNQGSIVIVNAYGLRCDAIIISTQDQAIRLQHISLPHMSGDEAQAWAETLCKGMQDLQGNKIAMLEYEAHLITVLRGLWKGLACPLLDHLRQSGGVKRVWWYPTGPLMFLPIHAASPCEEDQPGLPELMISSYIPSSILSHEHSSCQQRLQHHFESWPLANLRLMDMRHFKASTERYSPCRIYVEIAQGALRL